ncbi:MAG: OmpH family outer membrane protein [Endomicrobium sp.]|jgi:Skp family chaperone for outer membrane proteins|nr:OmpH family outer membrane protein [Endomicrobium sp.]
MVLKKIFLILFFTLFTEVSFCLEIPIRGEVELVEEPPKNKTKATSDNIILVDTEKVFNSHFLTSECKEKIKNFAKTRKDAVEKLVEEFNLFNKQVQDINLKISEAKSKNEPIDELFKQLDDICKLRDIKKREILDLSERTKNEMALMEEKNTAEVLKDIESLLRQELKRYNAAIVFDKQGVVTERCKDITDEVIKMVKDK